MDYDVSQVIVASKFQQEEISENSLPNDQKVEL